MRLGAAFLWMMSASVLLACRGELVLGRIDGGPGGGGSGSSSGGGADDGGVTIIQPDGGIAIPPQTLVVHKVDLLFMIDNSASMGDKQAYLTQAIPDLITRLLTPNCVDDTDPTKVDGPSKSAADGSADCSAYPSSAPEFPSIHDLHVGIVSSSLGPRLGDQQPADHSGGVCLPTATITLPGPNGTSVTLNNHNDDQAHLLTRSVSPADQVDEITLPDAASGFLAWFPNAASNSGASLTPGAVAITSAATLESDFSDLTMGVHEFGCGIESQLESWYRFLVQPDPYASLTLDTSPPYSTANPGAAWVGVDTTILKERHDFLRPDSLVAIVDLTDENDSEIDVRSIGQQGYLFMSTKFYPPHGSAACETNPADPSCTTLGTSDTSPYNSPLDWGYDLNLRHAHMKAKYGFDPQFPVQRYQFGLLLPKVPDRAGEYPVSGNAPAANYVGTRDCTNPLYAASLPDGSSTDPATLCNLAPGPRTPGLVYYLHIGGVPSQLLHYTPGNPAANALTSADWVKILGSNPLSYDYTGIDPHMIESYQPRPGLPGPTSSSTADPISGREWNTNVGPHVDLNVDLEYACVFKLVDKTGQSTPRDCSKTNGEYTVPANGYGCDCSSTVGSGGLTPDELSPVCDPANPNSQLYAKAYPTIRELTLAKLLGPQAVVSSICPIDVGDNAAGDDPLYGYRPALAGLVDRMRPALAYAGP